MTKYTALCAASGIVWAGIAWLIGFTQIPGLLWCGLLAAPVIGIITGVVYLPAYRHSRWVRALYALGTLYLAVALFGIAVGVADALRDIPGRSFGGLLLQGVLGTLWGVTFTGYVIILWPLAFANHGFLERYRESSTNPQ